MSFSKTTARSLGCVVLLLAAADLPAAQSATLETTTCALAVSNGVIVGLSNRLSGETLVQPFGQAAGLCAVHRLDRSDFRLDAAEFLTQPLSDTGLEWLGEWEISGRSAQGDERTWTAGANMRIWFEREPGTGDILVRQEGVSATRGWSAFPGASLPCRTRSKCWCLAAAASGLAPTRRPSAGRSITR